MRVENFFGMKVSSFIKTELTDYIVTCFNSNQSFIFYGYSLAALSYLKKYPQYYKITSQFDLFVTDGRLFYLLARLFGVNLFFDISIPRLTLLVLEIANSKGLSVYLLGGTLENNRIAQKNLTQKYKDIMFNGRNGFYDVCDEDKIISEIVKIKPNVILLGLPTPKKQEFALKLKPYFSNCVIIPCGGMIDVFAGKERLTPIFIKKMGLASLYRHLQHPKRLSELMLIIYRTFWVFFYCAFLKYILKKDKISIPEILSN